MMLCMSLVSCEKILMPQSKSTKPTVVFDELWNVVDRGYAQFEYKTLNWDSVYVQFRPMVSDTMTERKLYDVCVEMLNRLQDDQIQLNAGFATYHFDVAANYPANFNKHIVDKFYLKGYEKTGPLMHTIIDSVGYIYAGDFNEKITEAQLEVIVNRFRFNGGPKGVIFDVRDNRTGQFENIFDIFKRIDIPDTIPGKTTYLYSVAYKNGKERDKFSAVEDSWVEEKGTTFPGRFVVLTNRNTYGAATLFTAGSGAFTNTTVIGDTTGGGTSTLVSYELPNGWRIHVPGSKMMTSMGQNINRGLSPDIPVNTNPADDASGKDAIIEAALREILK